jgi:hypothetical protein
VIPSLAGEHRNATSSAAASGGVPPFSFRSTALTYSPRMPVGPAASVSSSIRVFIAPGATAFTSIPVPLSSSASVSPSRTKAVLAQA